MKTKKAREKGSTTLEYAILLPTVFACVFAVILVFLLLYQKAVIQNLAEETAESMSRQWGYKSVTDDEMSTGVYKKETYEEREIYWNLKIWENGGKEMKAGEYLRSRAAGAGPLQLFRKSPSGGASETGGSSDAISIAVDYNAGFPSVLSVEIKALYTVPGAGLMRLVGMGDFVTVKGYAEANVYDAKELINTTDYCVQLLRNTKSYQIFKEKTASLKDGLNGMLNR